VDLQLKESEKELDLELKETRLLSYIFATMVHHFVLEDFLCAWKTEFHLSTCGAGKKIACAKFRYVLCELKIDRSTSLQGKLLQHKLNPKVVRALKGLRNKLEEQERGKKWTGTTGWQEREQVYRSGVCAADGHQLTLEAGSTESLMRTSCKWIWLPFGCSQFGVGTIRALWKIEALTHGSSLLLLLAADALRHVNK
jgi:hypothetical protein